MAKNTLSLNSQNMTRRPWNRGSSALQIYLIARISPDAHGWNLHVTDQIPLSISVFLPQEVNPCHLPHSKIPRTVFETDLQAMKDADLGLILPHYGRDCSFEVGWFAGVGKPVVCFVDDQLEWLEDWMVKGGMTSVVTHNVKTYNQLLRDSFFHSSQIYLIKDISELGAHLLEVSSHSNNHVDRNAVVS